MTTTIDAPAPPPTPHCDRLDDGYTAIRGFLDHLAEQGLVIVPHADLHKVIHKAIQAEVILASRMGYASQSEIEAKLEADHVASQVSVDRPDPQKLLDEHYGVDQRELERERRALIQYNNQLHQHQHAVQERTSDGS